MTLLTFGPTSAKMDTDTDYTVLWYILAHQKTEHMLLIKDTQQQSRFPLSK